MIGIDGAVLIVRRPRRIARPWRSRLFDLLFGDVNLRQARRHWHTKVARVPERIVAYREAPEEVRRTVRMLLQEKVELRSSGNLAPAASSLIATITGAAGLVGGLLVSLFTQSLTTPVSSSYSPESQSQAIDISMSALGWTALVVVSAGIGVVAVARRRDRERANANTWLIEYRAIEIELWVPDDPERAPTNLISPVLLP